jgi:hypothetical protein
VFLQNKEYFETYFPEIEKAMHRSWMSDEENEDNNEFSIQKPSSLEAKK